MTIGVKHNHPRHNFLALVLTSLFLFFSFLFFLSSVQAVSYTWTDNGSGNNLFADQQNWNGGAAGFPDGHDDIALFSNSWVADCSVGPTTDLGAVIVEDSYTGTITQTGEVLTDTTTHNGTFCLGAGATWDSAGHYIIVDGSCYMDSSATYTHGDNVLQINGSSFYPGGHAFYNVTINGNCHAHENFTANASLFLLSGHFMLHNITITMGTSTVSGTIPYVSGAGLFYIENGSSANITAANESYYTINQQSSYNRYVFPGDQHIGFKWQNFTSNLGIRFNTTLYSDIFVWHDVNAENVNIGRLNYFNIQNFSLWVGDDAYDPDMGSSFYYRSQNGSLSANNGAIQNTYPGEGLYFSTIEVNNQTTNGVFYIVGTPGETIHIGQIFCNISGSAPHGGSLGIVGEGGAIEFTGTGGITATGTNNYLWIEGLTPPANITITGPASGWYFNTSQWDDWDALYLNLSNMDNSNGSQYFTYAGTNYTGNTQVDSETPIVQWESITDGMTLDKTVNGSLNVNLTFTDLSYIYEYEYDYLTIAETDDWTGYGEVHTLALNNSHSIAAMDPGAWTFYLNVSDSHNKIKSPEGITKAKDMVGDIGGELVGDKVKDKNKTKDGKEIKFKKFSTNETIYTITWLGVDDGDVTNLISWTQHYNFKLAHEIKLPATQSTITARFTARDIRYFPNSAYYAHLIIDGEYFYDAQDWEDVGGTCIVTMHNSTTVDIMYLHSAWEAGKKTDPLIDPLTGAVNLFSASRTINIGASPAEETVIVGADWALLNCSISGIGAYTANICIYDNLGNVLRKQTGIANNGWVRTNWTGISPLTTHRWRASANVNGVNVTSPWFSLTTSALLNITVSDWWDVPVNGADVAVYAQNGTMIYSGLTNTTGTVQGISIVISDLPLQIVAHKLGNYAQVTLSEITGNLTIFLFQYTASLEVYIGVVNNYTNAPIVIHNPYLKIFMNGEQITGAGNWIWYPINYTYVVVMDQFNRTIWSNNYTDLNWSGIPFTITIRLNYLQVHIKQEDENGDPGEWVAEWGIEMDLGTGQMYYFTGSTVGIFVMNESDVMHLTWNETNKVDGGGHSISDVSPHNNGGILANVQMSLSAEHSTNAGFLAWLAGIAGKPEWIVFTMFIALFGAFMIITTMRGIRSGKYKVPFTKSTAKTGGR